MDVMSDSGGRQLPLRWNREKWYTRSVKRRVLFVGQTIVRTRRLTRVPPPLEGDPGPGTAAAPVPVTAGARRQNGSHTS